MALINCKHCGHQISDKASLCPKCGTPTLSLNAPDHNTHTSEQHSSNDTTRLGQTRVAEKPRITHNISILWSILFLIIILGGGAIIWMSIKLDELKYPDAELINLKKEVQELIHQDNSQPAMVYSENTPASINLDYNSSKNTNEKPNMNTSQSSPSPVSYNNSETPSKNKEKNKSKTKKENQKSKNTGEKNKKPNPIPKSNQMPTPKADVSRNKLENKDNSKDWD